MTCLQFAKSGEVHSSEFKNLITIIFDAERFGYNIHMLYLQINYPDSNPIAVNCGVYGLGVKKEVDMVYTIALY